MLKFEFDVNETNTILAGLEQLPYKTVHSIIAKVKTEGDRQLAPTPEVPVSESTYSNPQFLTD